MKNLCFLAAPFSKSKLLTFGIFNESNIWAKVYHVFKLREYQTFGLMKMHNICKIWFASNIFSLWKRLVYDWPSKMLFLTFCLFPLPKFLKTIVKNHIMILRFLRNFYYVTNIFDLHIFENEMAVLLIFLFQFARICILVLYFF